jgi:hypothetical protein
MYNEMGLINHSFCAQVVTLKFRNHILNIPDNRLVKRLYMARPMGCWAPNGPLSLSPLSPIANLYVTEHGRVVQLCLPGWWCGSSWHFARIQWVLTVEHQMMFVVL